MIFKSSKNKWHEKWFSEKVCNYELITDPTVIIGGFSLESREWSLLNRFRTDFGCCNEYLSKYKFNFSPLWDCGPVVQTMHHISDFKKMTILLVK